MKHPAQPYLHFDGTYQEAMAFYQELFDGELNIQSITISESPMQEQFSAEVQNQILHPHLKMMNLP